MSGEMTANIGKKITSIFKRQYNVYYDHGENGENVKTIKGYLGERLYRSSAINQMDIAIIKGETIKYLFEIEESSFSPKKVMGDYCAFRVIEKVDIGEHPYKIDGNTKTYILGIVKSKSKKKQIDILSKSLMNSFHKNSVIKEVNIQSFEDEKGLEKYILNEIK